MNILEIIEKKREKQELTKEEIKYFVKGYVDGEIADYQAAALVMAIYLNGMTKQETTNLTIEMANSGEILDLSKLNKTIVDKHSTGGVGDKVSICLLPLVASLGVPVAKMSGRGLGFTGGTVDKMQSIPGYKTEIDIHKFIQNVENVGISMISQTMNLAPADKKLYALRDSISCVESIPLIASSIMSKKIASGAEKIVLDVTVGKGAFMKNMENAKELANEMIEIGKLANRETVCVLTNMNEPLGYAVGNNLEVIEAIDFLKGEMPKDLKQVVLELGAYMIKLAGLGEKLEENKNKMLENISNGKAYNKFVEMVKNQEGDISYLEDTNKFEKAKIIEPIIAKQDGYIQEINAEEIGKVACGLGAGRVRKEDQIDYSVGVILNKKVADKVSKGDILGYIHSNSKEKFEEAERKLEQIIKINENEIEKEPTIFGICK
jgi:pyrimidine-nucleoside phosphorylase